MKICILVERNELFGKIFSEEDFTGLEKLGAVEIWDGKEEKQKFAAGTDIIITSWGSPKIDNALLDAAPGLRFVFHAAGSIKSCVDIEIMKKGVRVSSASGVLSRNVAVTTFGLILASVILCRWKYGRSKYNRNTSNSPVGKKPYLF